MRAFGLGPRDAQVRMSDRRVLRTLLLGRGLSEGQLGAAFAAIDKSERDPKDVLAAKLREAGVGKRETDAVFEIAALRGLDAVLTALGKVKGGEEAGEPLRPADQASTKLDAFLIAVSGDDVAPLLKLAHQLRDRGVAVEYGLRPAAIRKQLELAAARGAPRAIIVGPDERAAGEVVVRDLKAGTEERVPIATLAQGLFH